MRLRRFAFALSLFSAACSAAPTDESVASSENQLALDQVPLPTLRTTLAAGDAYSPFIDERPLLITGQPGCLTDPKIELTPGSTELSASIVSTRRDLFDRLDLGVEGVPINIGKLAGATGTARLAVETDLNERSLNLMFQAKGTFESALTSVGAQPAAFNPSRVATCGWGYVSKAYHRLSAIVMVTIEATDGSSHVRLGCGESEENCTATSIGVGPVKAKLALEQMLKNGHFDIHVRSVVDVIPGLSPAPLSDIVALSSTPDTADAVIEKLDNALDWLALAQTQIATRIDKIRTDPTVGPAPTIKVDFTYWPGIEASLRDRVEHTFDEIVTLRKDYDLTIERVVKWNTFEDDRAAGFGAMYQVPQAPVATLEELEARANEAIGDQGFLTARRSDLETRTRECDEAATNDAARSDANALVAGLESVCHRLPAADPNYDIRYGVRRLAPLSVALKSYDEWGDHMCPDGQRIPTKDEAALLSPWSYQDNLWIQRESWIANPLYVSRGAVERVGLFRSPKYLAPCFDAAARSLFE